MERKVIGPIDIADLLQNIYFLLQETQKHISTTPALYMMYRVVLLDVNYVKIRLLQDKDLLEKATVFSSQPGGFRINYKEWHDKLESARFKWGLYDYEKTDAVCYEDPGFSIDELKDMHKEVWTKLHSEIDEVISLLSDLYTIINFPSEEKLMQTFDMLKNGYYRGPYVKDREEYDTFLLSVPKRPSIRITRLRNKLHDYKWAMFRSGFLDEMCHEIIIPEKELKRMEEEDFDGIINYQREGALDMLYDAKEGKWDKDLISRYIFTNRSRLSSAQINSFMRFTWQKDAIEKELAGTNAIDNVCAANTSKEEKAETLSLNIIYTETLRKKSVYDAYCKIMRDTIIPKVLSKVAGQKRSEKWRWPHVYDALKDARLGYIGKDAGVTDFGHAMKELNGSLTPANVTQRLKDKSKDYPTTADKNIITDIINALK